MKWFSPVALLLGRLSFYSVATAKNSYDAAIDHLIDNEPLVKFHEAPWGGENREKGGKKTGALPHGWPD